MLSAGASNVSVLYQASGAKTSATTKSNVWYCLDSGGIWRNQIAPLMTRQVLWYIVTITGGLQCIKLPLSVGIDYQCTTGIVASQGSGQDELHCKLAAADVVCCVGGVCTLMMIDERLNRLKSRMLMIVDVGVDSRYSAEASGS